MNAAFPAAPQGVQDAITALASGDPASREAAYKVLQDETAEPVRWADEVWSQFVALLKHEDNHVRSIAGQTLSRLAAGAEPQRVIGGLDALMAVTHDARFVTARHVLQSLWRVGMGSPEVRAALMTRLKHRFEVATTEKNGKLVRHDIGVLLRQLFDATADVSVRDTAMELIALETDAKYAKKYAGAWRGV